MVKCISCGIKLNIEEVEQGEIIDCPGCGIELEVIKSNPIMLEIAPQEEEDWGE